MMPLHDNDSTSSNSELLWKGRTALLPNLLADPEQLSRANDLRWGVSKKQSVGHSHRFDEHVSSLWHDSFNSTTTTFSTSSVDEDLPPQLPRRRTIGFEDTVQVREFDVILGDDRSLCRYPITLSWKHTGEYVYNLHEREVERMIAREDQQEPSWETRTQLEDRKSDDEAAGKNVSLRSEAAVKSARRLNTRERRLLLRSSGCSNTALVQSLRKRKIRLSLDYAYGYQDSLEAARCFQDEHFRYII